MAEDEAEKLLEEGNRLFEDSKYEEAMRAYDKVLAIRPKYAEAWEKKGNALGKLGRHQEAVESYDKALALNPNELVTWILRGFELGHLNRLQEVVVSYDKALAIMPEATAIWDFRGDVLLKLGNYQEAVESYEESLKQHPNDPFIWGKKVKALDSLEEWLKARRPPSLFTEIFEQVTRIEARLHIFIKQRLQKELGEEEAGWWYTGIPETIREECAKMHQKDPKHLPLYNYIYLIDLKEIIDKQWKYFDTDFQRIKTEFELKKEFLDSLVKLNEIRKSVMHWPRGSLTLSEEDLKRARHMREVIEQFCGPG